MATVGDLLERGIARLRASGAETPRLDAEVLLAHVVGMDRTGVIAHPDAPVGPEAAAAFESALVRRAAGEPVAYIRGFKEFYGLALAVDRRALIPRPETELLVALAEREVLRRLAASARPAGTPPIRVVDVGTGSGTIAVSLAVLLRRAGAAGDVAILATDRSPDALALARENAVGHGVADVVAFAEADLLPDEADAPFALVLANLPYVRSDVVPTLPIAASFEPVLALDGGVDGLAVIERLLARLPTSLEDHGVALLEIGADQGDDIGGLVARILPGWTCRVDCDLAGQPRVARIARR